MRVWYRSRAPSFQVGDAGAFPATLSQILTLGLLVLRLTRALAESNELGEIPSHTEFSTKSKSND